jgi:hypothetical protein
MSLDDWASTAEIISAIAVLITLIYLAIQVRQSTVSNKANAYQNWLAVHESIFKSLDDENLSSVINSGLIDTRNLTEENYVTFINWMRRYLYLQQAQYDLYRNGIINDELWECNLNDLIGIFRFPGARQYWEAGAKEHFSGGFVDLVESTEDFSPMLGWNKEKGFYATPYHSDGAKS